MDSIEAPLHKGEIVWAAGSPYIWRPYRIALDNLNQSRRIDYGRAIFDCDCPEVIAARAREAAAEDIFKRIVALANGEPCESAANQDAQHSSLKPAAAPHTQANTTASAAHPPHEDTGQHTAHSEPNGSRK